MFNNTKCLNPEMSYKHDTIDFQKKYKQAMSIESGVRSNNFIKDQKLKWP
jgi:hypothetical protein